MDRVFRGKISESGIVELKYFVDLFHLLLCSGVADSLQRLRLLKDLHDIRHTSDRVIPLAMELSKKQKSAT